MPTIVAAQMVEVMKPCIALLWSFSESYEHNETVCNPRNRYVMHNAQYNKVT